MTQRDLDELCQQMEQLRAQHRTGPLGEQQVWQVMQQASALLDKAQDSPFEAATQSIFTLVSAVWVNSRNQAQLRASRSQLS